MPTRFVAQTTIAKVEQRQRIVAGKAGSFDPATGQQVLGSLEHASDGWWITTEGPSPISIRVGDTAPAGVTVGMPAKIVLEV